MPTPNGDAPAASGPGGVEPGSYEVLRARLDERARGLRAKLEALNERRVGVFGKGELAVVGSERIRTENNCVPRDIVHVGDKVLLGYHVFLGLRTETTVPDVFSLHHFRQDADGFSFPAVAAGSDEDFLDDPAFVRDFRELFRYYASARLVQLRRVDDKLLAVFQVGAAEHDTKVLRWSVDDAGVATYVDNRGERDNVFPPAQDFEWTPVTRADHVGGRHPHASINREVFVETVHGDLTIKIENNTEDGLGVYREPVEDPNQGLGDAQILWAKLGVLVLLKIRPYKEHAWRHLVYNTRTRHVVRIDAIEQSCVQLPEDHGIVFPGGYYLRSGDVKTFDGSVVGMRLQAVVRSPNAEDILYVFHRRDEGRFVLLCYNVIRKEAQVPIHCHGYSLYADGKMIVFRATSDEPSRVHPMQVWQTPFTSAEHAAAVPSKGTYLEKIGNPELIRGISDGLGLCRMAESQRPSRELYEDLVAASSRVLDAYHWLDHAEAGRLQADVAAIRSTAELVIDEFEKVEALRARAAEAVARARADVDQLLEGLDVGSLETVEAHVETLQRLRDQRGRLVTLRDLRYADVGTLAGLEERAAAAMESVGMAAVAFLLREDALAPHVAHVEDVARRAADATKVSEITPLRDELAGTTSGLELLAEVASNLPVEDVTQRTRIIQGISAVLARLNQARAVLEARRRTLLEQEGSADLGAQLNLFSQALGGALALASEPEQCDAQLSRLLVQLEEMESRFSELPEFLEEIAVKREEATAAFAARKQVLLDERHRHARHVQEAADRVLQGVTRRAASFGSADELNAFFVADAMVAKVRDLCARLRELGDSVHADEIEGRLKVARDEAARIVRDRAELFEEGQSLIRLGRHRFTVNAQRLDLALVPRDGALHVHVTGTDFFEPIAAASLQDSKDLWDQVLVSEAADVYRGEFLAASLLAEAEDELGGLSMARLQEAATDGERLLALVRERAAQRHDEGYERGVHDEDAAKILGRLVSLRASAGLLRFAARPRAWACLFWAFSPGTETRGAWERRAQSLARLQLSLGRTPAVAGLASELAEHVSTFLAARGLGIPREDARLAGSYLLEELARGGQSFVASSEAIALRDAFLEHLELSSQQRALADDIAAFGDDWKPAFDLLSAWMAAYLERGAGENGAAWRHATEEAVTLVLTRDRLPREPTHASASATVEGLLGHHPRIHDRRMEIRLDELLARLTTFRHERVPRFRAYLAERQRVLSGERARLRLGELEAKVMSSFVRNRLVDEIYLPLIGDNLAKQIGAAGRGKRADLMGLLLLVSPPGYGKTTLMEYVANRLGLVFVKVNGPALGHDVTSLDPAEARNATARQEVERINFALEMGNNVLLYLDDIQHVSPELLQKFISLCDAQRKIEGVWNGRTRTHDLRGKRFVACMAGNPYTESGARFRIPDMLANRADTHNLGDVVQGRDDLFALSYLENTLTSNRTLAPIAQHDPKDLHALLALARGEEIAPGALSHDYSAVELSEMQAVLRKLVRAQEVLLTVNRQYIASATQEDAFRTEPAFRLQGSYRNMNKIAERVVPAMDEAELERLVDDHYQSEAQTLTVGAEASLLKLAELRGRMSHEQRARWDEVKSAFRRVQVTGGADGDPVTRIVGQVGLLSERVAEVGRAIGAASAAAAKPVAAAAPAHPASLASPELVAQIGVLADRIDGVAEKLADALRAARPAAGAPVADAHGEGALAEVVGRLDRTLATLGQARPAAGGEALRVLVHDLLARQVEEVAESLQPALNALGRRTTAAATPADRRVLEQVNKALKDFDMVKELARALHAGDDAALAVHLRRAGSGDRVP